MSRDSIKLVHFGESYYPVLLDGVPCRFAPIPVRGREGECVMSSITACGSNPRSTTRERSLVTCERCLEVLASCDKAKEGSAA